MARGGHNWYIDFGGQMRTKSMISRMGILTASACVGLTALNWDLSAADVGSPAAGPPNAGSSQVNEAVAGRESLVTQNSGTLRTEDRDRFMTPNSAPMRVGRTPSHGAPYVVVQRSRAARYPVIIGIQH